MVHDSPSLFIQNSQHHNHHKQHHHHADKTLEDLEAENEKLRQELELMKEKTVKERIYDHVHVSVRTMDIFIGVMVVLFVALPMLVEKIEKEKMELLERPGDVILQQNTEKNMKKMDKI